MAEGLRAATSRLVRYLAPVGLKQSPLRRFCEDGFLGFRAKTEIPGLIEATPAKRGVGKIFANPMATAAAIDRIVHHSVILEFDLSSYRTNAAQNRQAENESDRQK